MLSITPIPAFNDNYIWCLHNDGQGLAAVVDPGDARPVMAFLTQHGLQLSAILVTHHHADHTGGVKALRDLGGVTVYGPANSRFSAIDVPLKAGNKIHWNTLDFEIFEIPGHTLDHIAYFSAEPPTHERQHNQPLLFCGDTLFNCGCGRVFEGSLPQMQQSLALIRDLPDDTAVYCAHEYTLANLAFARHVLPDDAHLSAYTEACQARRDRGLPTVPFRLGDDKTRNPFLRWDDPQAVRAASAEASRLGGAAFAGGPVDTFSLFRRWKDVF